jgi:hypothetical protein
MHFKTILKIIGLVAAILLPPGSAIGQQCSPCDTHCSLVGSAANAACVASGEDPVHCGNVQDVTLASIINAGRGPQCTTSGLCYREGQGAKNACLAACFICTPSTVHPDFLLISILYAPPGNASTAAFGQSKSTGTIYGISSNVTEALNTSIAINEGSSFFGLTTTFTSGSSDNSGASNQFSAVTTAGTTTNLKPGKDMIDHTQDIFLLWVNPEVTLTKSDQKTLAAAIASGQGQMSIQAVSANQLMNGIPPEKLAPTQICPTPTTCYALPGLGSLTKDDISQILAQDPFLKSTPDQIPDPSRFLYIQSNPLENTTVAGNATQTFTVSDAQTTSSTATQALATSEGVVSGVSAKTPYVGISVASTDTWTWTQTISHGTSTGQTQQASVTLSSTTQTCCGVTNNVTCEVSIWEDMVYRTFVFVPQPQTCQPAVTGVTAAAPAPIVAATTAMHTTTEPALKGTVTARDGTAAKATMVVISDRAGKVLSRIVTDHQGRYFSGNLPLGPVIVTAGTKTQRSSIKAGQAAVLNLKL